MNVTRVLHVSLNVEGALEETRAFYEDVLGLGSKHRPEITGIAGHWFAVGPAELHLVDAPVGRVGIQPSTHHYCVAVSDLDSAVTGAPAVARTCAPGELRAPRKVDDQNDDQDEHECPEPDVHA